MRTQFVLMSEDLLVCADTYSNGHNN